MRIELLVRRYIQMIGLARYTTSLVEYLTRTGMAFTVVEPSYPPIVRAAHWMGKGAGLDIRTFFSTYPVSAPFSSDSLKHLTVQQMASLLFFRPRLRPVIVTAHDIVPYLMRDELHQDTYLHPIERLFDVIAMRSLRHADHIIAISEYTRRQLIAHLGCSGDRISVVLYGIDHDLFHPVPRDTSTLMRLGFDPQTRFVLYIGSENPRKNLPRLMQAFARLIATQPDVKLVKVGTPQYLAQHKALVQQVQNLDLEQAVVLLEHPSPTDLVAIYSAADIFVFPSLYEGFGLPPLEAMACGTPVVCSNAASLPEVVGDAALTVNPYDVEALADAMRRVLTDKNLRGELREKGLARAAQFTWERTAQETIRVYQAVLNGRL